MPANPFDEVLEQLPDQPQATNPFDEVVQDAQDSRASRMRWNIREADKTTPERRSETLDISRRTGLPAPVVERNFEDARRRMKLGSIPYAQILDETPKLAEWLGENVDNAAIAADDMENLGALEWIVTAPQRALQQGIEQITVARLQRKAIFEDLTQAERDQLNASKFYMQHGGQLGAGKSWFRGAVTGSARLLPNLAAALPRAAQYGVAGALEVGVLGAAGGAVIGAGAGGAGAVPGAIAGGTGGAALGFKAGALYGAAQFGFELEAGLAYDEFLDLKDEYGQPMDPNAAKAGAIAAGALNAGLEAFGLAVLAKSIPGVDKLTGLASRAAIRNALRVPTVRAALGEAFKSYGTTLTAETATEVAQRAITILSGELAKSASGQAFPTMAPGDFAGELGKEAIGAAQSFLLLSAPGPAMRVARAQRQAQAAQQNVDFFQALGEGAAASKTIQRQPEAARAFIEKATADGPIPTVYAPVETWTTYWQSKGQDPAEIAAQLTGDRNAYKQALDTGGDLAIPTSVYAVRLAGTEHNAFFAQELRLGADEMNAREAAAFQAIAQQQPVPTDATTADQIRQQVIAQATQLGAAPAVAEAWGDLYASGFGTMAESAGVDPLAVFQGYGLQIERPELGAQAQPTPPPTQAAGAPAEGAGAAAGAPAQAAAPAAQAPGQPAAQPAAQGAQAVTGAPPVAEGATGAPAPAAQPGAQPGAEAAAPEPDPLAVAEGRVPYQPPAQLEPASPAASGIDRISTGVQTVDDAAVAAAGAEAGLDVRDAAREQPEPDEGRAAEGRGDGDRLEPRRLPSADDLGVADFDTYPEGFTPADRESDAGRLTETVRRELTRIVAELREFPFQPRTWYWRPREEKGKLGNAAGGSADIIPGAAGAPVYDDILNYAPLGKGRKKGEAAKEVRGSRGAVQAAVEKLLETGRISTNIMEGAVRVAERREPGQYRRYKLSAPILPPEWGVEAAPAMLEELSASIDDAMAEVSLLEDVDERELQPGEEAGDTSFNVEEFGQSLFEDLEPVDPKADTLTTGEVQPRLPGAEDVREQEVATPQLEAPFALTSEVSTAKKGKQTTLFQSAFHGSPHLFERFSLHAIGSGEGAQAYGWGLYFASRREVAEYYRDALGRTEVRLDGVPINMAMVDETGIVPGLANRVDAEFVRLVGNQGSVEAALDVLGQRIERNLALMETAVGAARGNVQSLLDEARDMHAAGVALAGRLETENQGRLYKVEIPDDDVMLNWDKPASQQPPKVQDALRALGVTWEPFTPKTIHNFMRWFDSKEGDRLWNEDIGIREEMLKAWHYANEGMIDKLNAWQEQHQGLLGGTVDPTGESIYRELHSRMLREEEHRKGPHAVLGMVPYNVGARLASETLNAQGVVGIRYSDAFSRRQEGEGSANYVVFDDKLVEITEFFQTVEPVDEFDVRDFELSLRERFAPDLVNFDINLTNQGDLHLQTITVRRGAQRAGMGTQVMRELTAFADRHGLRLTLSPAHRNKEWGTTSRARLVQFYKRFGFVENKGRRKDFTISAGMYREPTIPVGGETRQPSAVPQVESAAFKKWFGQSKIVDEDGKPLVVYHGTTGDFETFDRERGNIESDFGAGIYFSNNPSDVAENYAGMGPDLQSKLERRIERLTQDYDYDEDTKARVDAYIEEQGTGTSVGEAVEVLAKQDLGVEHGGLSMPVYLKMENPAIVGGDGETVLTYEVEYEPLETFDQDEVQELRDSGMEDDEIRMELSDRNRYDPTEKGTLVDFIAALRQAANRFDDGDIDTAVQEITEAAGFDSIPLSKAIDIFRQAEGTGYFTDPETGDLAQAEVLRQALEIAGYDGVIDNTVDKKFGSQKRTGKPMAGMDPDTVHYIVFQPTQIKSSIGNVGTFSRTDPSILRQEKRGAIRFGPDRQFTISLLEKADLSTFLHETGHFFLEVMGDLVDQVQAIPLEQLSPRQRKLLADYGTILQTFGVENRRDITTAHHEQFARMFEAYLMEGKAPSLALRQAFIRFRAWLVGIYRSLRGLRVELTPEVRGVMDRMLASEVAIAEAEAAGRVAPMFLDAATAGMSEADFALYRETVQRASDTARELLERRVLSEVQREREADWKEKRAIVEEEVQTDVYSRPVYQALAAITRGTNPDGTPLEEGFEPSPMRLSKRMISERYGTERSKRLPPFAVSRDAGVDPDAVAQRFGFSSGDALLTALEDAPPMRAVIQQETDRQMLERHGSILLDGTLLEKAAGAIANDDRELIIRAELRALGQLRRTVQPFQRAEQARAGEQLREANRERAYERRWLEAEARLRIAIAEGRKQVEIDALADEVRNLRQKARGGAATIRAAVPPMGAIRDAAKAQIARTRFRDIQPHVFWSASRRAAQKALDAAARQDFEAAILAKQQELMNLALYREAERVKDSLEARVRGAKALGRPKERARLGLAGDTYLDQVDGILDRFEFARVSQKVLDRRAALNDFVRGLEGEGIPVDLPAELLNEARRRNYQELSVEELIGVLDGLDQIVYLARFKNRLLKHAQQRELDQVAHGLSESIREHARSRRREPVRDRRPSEERRRSVGDWFAGHRKLASFLREFDGFEDGGQAWEAIMRPLNAAGDREAEMLAAATQKFGEMVERAFPRSAKRQLYVRVDIPAIGKSLSRMERIMVALNWGNEGNRDRLRRGEGWTDDQVTAILNTLSASDLQFVQDVFDFIGSYKPEIAEKQKRVYGLEPEWVEPVAITTAHGTIRGGYFPIKDDDRLSASQIAKLDLEAANLARQAAYAHATTKRGHTQARVATRKARLRLDFGAMFEHVGQVIHDLTHHEALIDVGRILGHKDVQDAILETHGDLVYRQLRNAVRDIAFGDVPARGGFERAINHLRMGTTIAMLGWNLTTSALQPMGLFNSVNRIGVKWVARGIGRWFRNPTQMVDTVHWITDKSAFMRARARTQQREINEIRNALGVNTGKLTGWVDEALAHVPLVSRQGVADSYFFFIQQMQRLADIPTWLGAYEKAMEHGEPEDRAIALADQAVLDSQGGGQIKDLAEVQRGGPMMRLWTNFYSFFNVLYNQAVESRRKGRGNYSNPLELGRLASDYVILFVAPAALAYFLRAGLRPGEEDDEDALAWALTFEVASYISGTMLGAREIAGTLAGYYGYEGPAGARAFAALSRTGQQLRQGEVDEALLRSLNETAGIMLHYPATQTWRTLTGIAALAEGKTENPVAVVGGAPRD